MCVFVFFFKQKTAYEVRISDWSSDVCSSDLAYAHWDGAPAKCARGDADTPEEAIAKAVAEAGAVRGRGVAIPEARSEERRVGEAGVSTCTSRWAPSQRKHTTERDRNTHT